mgnify:CR=1 FL=1
MAKIRFHSLEIGVIRSSSGLFSGVNIQRRWRHYSRSSDGFGTVDGNENRISRNVAIVNQAAPPLGKRL